MAILGINARVEIGATYDVAKTVTAITAANPPVVTSTAHGYANGDYVVMAVSSGMVELDGQGGRVANVTANTFEIESLDATGASSHTGGTATVKRVATWKTLASATNVSAPGTTPNKIETTRLIDKVKTYDYGLPEAPEGTIDQIFDPFDQALVVVRGFAASNTASVLRMTTSQGYKWITNAKWAAAEGFTMSQGAAATSTVSFTPLAKSIWYAA